MDALVVGYPFGDQKDLVWKICDDLVYVDFHIVDVKESDFGALGKLF